MNMFTIKICNAGHSIYYETEAITREVVENNHILLSFNAQGEERKILFWGLATGDKELPNFIPSVPEYLPTAEKAYVMNCQGKTIDIIR